MSVGQPWSQALIHLGWGMPTKERIQQAGVNLGSCGNVQVCPLGEGFNAVSHTESSDGRPQKVVKVGTDHSGFIWSNLSSQVGSSHDTGLHSESSYLQ